jgi:hypothetical protein
MCPLSGSADHGLWGLARSVEVCKAKGKSSVVCDTIRWRIAGADVAINLHEVFAGLP